MTGPQPSPYYSYYSVRGSTSGETFRLCKADLRRIGRIDPNRQEIHTFTGQLTTGGADRFRANRVESLSTSH